MELQDRDLLREYNSLIRAILNNVNTIYQQHYEISRLSMIYNHENNINTNSNTTTTTSRNTNFTNRTTNRTTNRNTNRNTNFTFPNTRTPVLNTIGFTNRNPDPTSYNNTFRRNRHNPFFRRRQNNNTNTRINNSTNTINRPIWTPFTNNLPLNIGNFINNTLDTPPTLDFPSYQQIETSTISIKYKDVSNNSNDFCPITQESFSPEDNIIKILKCNHIFKRDSLLNWFNTSSRCPICRFDIRNHIIDSSINIVESKTNQNSIESKTNQNSIESKTNSIVPPNTHVDTSQPVLFNSLYAENTFNSLFPNNNTTDWSPPLPCINSNLNSDTSNNLSTFSNIVSNNIESVINNFENAFTGAIENTIQDLSDNNINAELCYELFFPPPDAQ